MQNENSDSSAQIPTEQADPRAALKTAKSELKQAKASHKAAKSAVKEARKALKTSKKLAAKLKKKRKPAPEASTLDAPLAAAAV